MNGNFRSKDKRQAQKWIVTTPAKKIAPMNIYFALMPDYLQQAHLALA